MFAIIESRMCTVQIANICELFVCQTTRPVSILELFLQVFSTRGRHAFRFILFRRTSIIILYCRRGKRRFLCPRLPYTLRMYETTVILLCTAGTHTYTGYKNIIRVRTGYCWKLVCNGLKVHTASCTPRRRVMRSRE